MKRKTIMMALWSGTVVTTAFADVAPMDPWTIDTRALDDYHYFLYNGGQYISFEFLIVAIGVLCVAFLAWRLVKKDQCGTWFATLRNLSPRLLLGFGLLGVLLMGVISIFGTFGGNPLFYLDVPWNRAAYDRRCIECYESNGREYARRSGAVDCPIEPRKNAPAEVQEAYDRFIGTRWRKSGWFDPVKEEAQTMQAEKRRIKSAKKFE